MSQSKEDKFEILNEKLRSIRSSSENKLEINVSEFDEIGDKIIEVKAKLEAYALKTEKSLRNRISTIPILNKFVSSSQKIVDNNKDIGELLNEMLSYFDSKYDVIILKVEDFEKLEKKLLNDIKELQEWIVEAESLIEKTESKSKKLAINKQITVAKMDIIAKKDTVDNKLNPSISIATVLAENIDALSPVLKSALQEELRVTSGLNTFKDASTMLVELKGLVVNLKKINNLKTEDMMMDILSNTNTSLFTADELNKLIEDSDKSKQNVIRYAEKIHNLTIDNIEKIDVLEKKINSNNLVENHEKTDNIDNR